VGKIAEKAVCYFWRYGTVIWMPN